MTKAVMFSMDPNRKQVFGDCAARIIEVCRDEFHLNPLESYAVLKLCLECMGASYGIEDTLLLKNETDMKQ